MTFPSCWLTIGRLNGYNIPPIAFGISTPGEEEEMERAFDAALESGHRNIDTANYYNNEVFIGKVLKKWFDSGKLKREDIFVTTKLTESVFPQKVELHVKKSLENLQLDYIDLYLIHCIIINRDLEPGEPAPFQYSHFDDLTVQSWKILEEQVDLGRIKTIGLSNFNIERVGKIISNSRIKPACNRVEPHTYLQRPELVKYCQDNGIAVNQFDAKTFF